MQKQKSIITLIVFLLIISLSLNACFYNQCDIEFTQNKWNNDIWKRYRMLNSLYEKYDLSNMTKNEIIELLGVNGTANVYDHSLDYYIKKDIPGPRLLAFSFDNDGNVIEFDVYTDQLIISTQFIEFQFPPAARIMNGAAAPCPD